MGGAAAILLTGLWGYLLGLATIKQIVLMLREGRGKAKAGSMKRLLIEVPFLNLIDRAYRSDTFQLWLNAFHMKLFILNGSAWTKAHSNKKAALSIGNGYAAMTGCSWLAWMSGESLLLAAGILAFAGLGFRSFAEAGKELECRRKAVIAALPDRMSNLMLLVSAGETVHGAFMRCMDGKEGSRHPLDVEWKAAVSAMRNGMSFSAALERFNRSCSVQEASLFTTVILLNYRKGGEHFVLAVRELSSSLWEKRKGIARISGEEASSKLVFPLVGIMIILMVLVAAPAVMLLA